MSDLFWRFHPQQPSAHLGVHWAEVIDGAHHAVAYADHRDIAARVTEFCSTAGDGASYYQGGQSGHTQTKSGMPVNLNSNEAASPNLPLGSQATVINKNTGKSTDVKVTDRGPTRHDRVIDLSKKSVNDVGMEKQGTAPVTVQPK